MKKALYSLFLSLFFLTSAFFGFFFWGSSSQLSPDEYATLVAFDSTGTLAEPVDTFSVMSYNIGYLSGMTNNRPVLRTNQLYEDNLDAAVGMFARLKPDILALQEIDFGSDRSKNVDQFVEIARQNQFRYGAREVNWDKRYVPFPYGFPKYHFGKILSGQAILSQFSLSKQRRIALQKTNNPWYYNAFYLDRLAQVVQVDVGEPIVVINVHLEAFELQTRQKQAEAVRNLYRQYSKDFPVLLLGDFNAAMSDQKIQSDLPESHKEVLRNDQTLSILLEEDGIFEAFDVLRKRGKMGSAEESYTFPADEPSVGIDHIFYNATRLEPIEAYVVDEKIHPSDHRAIFARFKLLANPETKKVEAALNPRVPNTTD